MSEIGLISYSSQKRQAKGGRDPLLGRYRLWDKGPVAGARREHVGLIGQGLEPCASVGGGAALDGAVRWVTVGVASWSAASPSSQINIRSSNHMRCTCGEAERFTASQPFLLSAPVRPHGQTYHFETVASRRGPWWRFTAGPGDRVTLRWVGCLLGTPAGLGSAPFFFVMCYKSHPKRSHLSLALIEKQAPIFIRA